MIPTPEMAYAELVGNRLLVAVLGRARVLAIPRFLPSSFLFLFPLGMEWDCVLANTSPEHLTTTTLSPFTLPRHLRDPPILFT